MKTLINAQQAKSKVYDISAQRQRAQLFAMKDSVAEAIKQASDKGMVQTAVTLPVDLDPTLVNAFKRVLEKLGYKASLETITGYHRSPGNFDGEHLEGIFVAPKVVLTVRWDV